MVPQYNVSSSRMFSLFFPLLFSFLSLLLDNYKCGCRLTVLIFQTTDLCLGHCGKFPVPSVIRIIFFANMNPIGNEGIKRHNRLFVARLAKHTKKGDLLRLFGPLGMKHVVIRRAGTGDTAYLTFSEHTDVNEIIRKSMAEGFYLRGRKLRILLADPWNQRESGKKERSEFEHRASSPTITSAYSPVLPAICVERIARYVNYYVRARMEMVSRSWREGSIDSHRGTTTLDPSNWLWQKTWETCAVSPAGINWALRRMGPSLLSLMLGDPESCKLTESQLVTVAARNCPKLEMVNTKAILLRPGSLRVMAENIGNLRELYLGKIRGPVDPDLGRVFWTNKGLAVLELEGTQIYGQSLAYLGDGLVTVHLEQCHKLRAEPLGELLRRQRNLVSLRVAQCSSLNKGQGYVIRGLLSNTHLGATLRSLELLALGYGEEQEGLDGEEEREVQYRPIPGEDFVVLQEPGLIEEAPALAAVCGGLESLSVPLCPWVDNRFVIQIGEHLQGLKDLNLSACTSILGEEALDPLGRLHSLESLNISSLMPEVSMFFLRSLQCLVRLEARDCRGAHPEDICAFIRRATQLQHLDLEGCPMVDRTVVTCCYDTLRGAVDGRRLEVYLGETAARRHRRDRSLMTLTVHYIRFSPRLRIL